MKVSELFETTQSKEEIDQLLKTHFRIRGNIEYHDDGSISVDGDVLLTDDSITRLPVKFRKVSEYFDCSYTNLTSLEGSPQEVGSDFSCDSTKITSLKGGPKKVGGEFCCDDTKIASLDGAPEFVGGDFYCENTNISSLEGVPKFVGGFYFENTPFYKQFLIDENIQISAVRYLPKQFINMLNANNIKISQTVQIVAVDTDPTVIRWIKNPTRMAQLTAVKNNPSVIKYIENPDPLVLQYLAKK